MVTAPPEETAADSLTLLSVVLALRSGPVAGELRSLEISQTTIDFHPPNMPQLPLGVVVPLEFTTPGLKKAVRLSALIVARTEIGGCRRYSFQFKLKEGQDVGDLFRLFNRRTSYRALAHKPVSVSVYPAEIAARELAKPIMAELFDISMTGIALVVTPEQDMKVGADNVFIEFELSGASAVLKMLVTIRYRVLMHSKAVRYGCAYNPNSPGFLTMEDLVVKYLMRYQQNLLKHRGSAD